MLSWGEFTWSWLEPGTRRAAPLLSALCLQFHNQPGISVSISHAAASIERVTHGGVERNVLSNSLSSSGEPLGAASTFCRSFLRSTFRNPWWSNPVRIVLHVCLPSY